MNRRKSLLTVLAASALALAAGLLAQKVDKSPNQKERSLELAEEEVKQLLLLMDADKSGKISRQEYLNFMAAEFDRLDTDKSGELDVKELAQSRLRVSHPAAVGK